MVSAQGGFTETAAGYSLVWDEGRSLHGNIKKLQGEEQGLHGLGKHRWDFGLICSAHEGCSRRQKGSSCNPPPSQWLAS